MSTPTVLISGASIAGPACAIFLSRYGFKCTIIERAPELRTAGQQIDLRGLGLVVAERMGLLETIKGRTTKEQGLQFVDSTGYAKAEFGVNDSGEGGQAFSSEIEILRGTLADVLVTATKDSTEYVFGDYITGLEEQDSDVRVSFNKGEARTFDYVLVADGMRSRTRDLLFPGVKDECLSSAGQFVAYFTVPVIDEKETWAQWYNAPGRRCLLLRPDVAAKSSRCCLAIISEEARGYEKLTVAEQKDLVTKLFADAGWVVPKVLEGMKTSEDFYMQEIAQVKLDSWSKGRVALLGDAGYCPSPISGMGTSLAFVGAYVLAGELGRNKGDHRKAFEEYEKLMRPYVTSAQKLPPGAPAIASPQTAWGISVFNTVLGVAAYVSTTSLASWVTKLTGGPAKEKLDLPDYESELMAKSWVFH